MTCYKSKFYDLDTGIGGHLKFMYDSMIFIKKGEIYLQCKKHREKRVLRDVYYIPSLRINIISLGKLAKEIFKVIMHGIFFFWVYGSKNELLIKVKIGSYRIYKNLVKTVKPMYLLSKSLIKNGFSISTLVMLTFNQLNSWMTKTWLLICQVLFHQIKYMRFL